MKYIGKGILRSLIAIFVCCPLYANQNTQPNLEFSGFGRLVAGILDDNNASYEGYEDRLSVSEHSLLGVQLDARLSLHWSVTGQAIAHASSREDSGLEWLYVTYQPNNALRIKTGKLRTPFYNYSDVLDVGYAYHFISPPQQVYSPYFFDSFNGIGVNYNLSQALFDAELELYYGKYDDDIDLISSKMAVEVNKFRGIALNLHKGNFKFRVSAHTGTADMDMPEISMLKDILRQASYTRSADSLVSSGQVTGYQLGINYEAIDYFVRSEFVHFSTSVSIYPEINSYYLSYGYIFYPFTAHITYANINSTPAKAVVEIPTGFVQEVDALAVAYQQVFDSIEENTDDIASLALGLRWDFSPGMAAKLEWTHLKGEPGKRSFFTVREPDTFDYRANLFQVALEWTF